MYLIENLHKFWCWLNLCFHGSLFFIRLSSYYVNFYHQDRTSPSIICWIIREIRTYKYSTKHCIYKSIFKKNRLWCKGRVIDNTWIWMRATAKYYDRVLIFLDFQCGQEYKIYVWIGTSLNTNFMGNSMYYSRDIILHWKLFESMFSGAIEYCMSRIFF